VNGPDPARARGQLAQLQHRARSKRFGLIARQAAALAAGQTAAHRSRRGADVRGGDGP